MSAEYTGDDLDLSSLDNSREVDILLLGSNLFCSQKLTAISGNIKTVDLLQDTRMKHYQKGDPQIESPNGTYGSAATHPPTRHAAYSSKQSYHPLLHSSPFMFNSLVQTAVVSL
jgi:hypothetical protein